MMKIDRFHVACTADLAQIASMVNLAYRPESSSSAWTHESDLVDGRRTNFDYLAALISKSDSTIITGFRNNSLVGCIHLKKEGGSCHLGLFAIHPNFQGQGNGKQLLEYAEQFALKHYRSEKFVMTVLSARHELIEFYLRRGYRRTGVIGSYPLSAGIGTPKLHDLKIEMLEKQSTLSAPNLH
jgi:ribosomal protein S18 acetylase RimI-like enzyme